MGIHDMVALFVLAMEFAIQGLYEIAKRLKKICRGSDYVES